MEPDKFEMNKSNKVLLVITIILLLLNVIFGIITFSSLNNKITDLPNLETTLGKTSTRSTAQSTSYTTTTVTTKAIRDKSPYYDVSIDSILSNELITKQNLTLEERNIVVKEFSDFVDAFFNLKNNNLFDIESTIKGSKPGELDKIIENNHNYGEIYNGEAIINKAFINDYINRLYNTKFNDIPIFIKKDDKVYRVEDILDKKYPVYESDDKLIYITNATQTQIEARIYYHLANYQEEGRTSPVTEYTVLQIRYSIDRWKIERYDFPSYK